MHLGLSRLQVASGAFCETTIGFRNEAHGKIMYKLFNAPTIQESVVEDVETVEICGALKNVSSGADGVMCRPGAGADGGDGGGR